MRRLIKTDGTWQDYDTPVGIAEIHRLIGADMTDVIAMRHMGKPVHVMFVDDNAYESRSETRDMGGYTQIDIIPVRALKPLNAEATRMYLANCLPEVDHQIVGDVFVCPDEDFE